MKSIETSNHKKTAIGTSGRTVELTSQSRVSKKRTVNRNTISASKMRTRRLSGNKTGCSGCSRNKK